MTNFNCRKITRKSSEKAANPKLKMSQPSLTDKLEILDLPPPECSSVMYEFELDQLAKQDLKKFLKWRSENGENFLLLTAKENECVSSIRFLTDFMEKEFDKEELRAVLIDRDNFDFLPLHVTVQHNRPEIFELFFAFYQRLFTKKELKILIETSDKNIFAIARSNATHRTMIDVVREKFVKFSPFFYFSHEFSHLIEHEVSDEVKATKLFDEMHEKLTDAEILMILHATNENGEDFFQLFAQRGSPQMLAFAFGSLKRELPSDEFEKFLTSKNEFGHNFLHLAVIVNRLEDSIQFLLNFMDSEAVLLDRDDFNFTPLHYAIRCNSVRVFEILFDTYLRFDIKKLLNERIKMPSGDEKLLFELARDNPDGPKMFQAVREKFIKFSPFSYFSFEFEHAVRNSFVNKIAKTADEMLDTLSEEESRAIFESASGNFELLVQRGFVATLKFIERHFRERFLEDFNAKNYLQVAIRENRSEESLTFLLNFAESELSRHELKKVLLKRDEMNFMLIHQAVNTATVEILHLLISFYERNFVRKEFKKILKEKVGAESVNFYELTSRTENEEMVKIGEEVREKYKENNRFSFKFH